MAFRLRLQQWVLARLALYHRKCVFMISVARVIWRKIFWLVVVFLFQHEKSVIPAPLVLLWDAGEEVREVRRVLVNMVDVETVNSVRWRFRFWLSQRLKSGQVFAATLWKVWWERWRGRSKRRQEQRLGSIWRCHIWDYSISKSVFFIYFGFIYIFALSYVVIGAFFVMSYISVRLIMKLNLRLMRLLTELDLQ